MKTEWRIVHQTKSSSLKRLWIYDGIWQPTERYMWDGVAMPVIGGGAPGTVDRTVDYGEDDGEVETWGWGEFYSGGPVGEIGKRYSAPPGVGDYESHIWLRWRDVTYGGAVVVSYITIWTNSQIGNPELRIYGVDEDSPLYPTSYSEFMNEPLTSAYVTWTGPFSGESWKQSPSLNPIFQELIDKRAVENDAVMVQIRNAKIAPGEVHNTDCVFWEYQAGVKRAKLHIEFGPRVPRPPAYGLDPMIF